MSGGRAPARASGPGWFAVITGEDHPELNECALTSHATAADARALADAIAAAGVPALLSVASTADAEVETPLAAAGFVRGPADRGRAISLIAEPMPWRPRPPAVRLRSSPIPPAGWRRGSRSPRASRSASSGRRRGLGSASGR